MKAKLFMIVLAILASACQPAIPVSGSWDFYSFCTNPPECPENAICINKENHTTCLFAGDRFACGTNGEVGGTVRFDGETLELQFDQRTTTTYWGTFQPDGTVSGVWASDKALTRIGTWWMEKK